MTAKEKRGEIMLMLYQNMDKHAAEETIQLVDQFGQIMQRLGYRGATHRLT